MIKLKNIKFLIKEKHHPDYSVRAWSKYIFREIIIPDNIWKSLTTDTLIDVFLLGWFYEHNTNKLKLSDIDYVLIDSWEIKDD